MSPSDLARDWLNLPDDPDPETDLGYLLLELEFISTSTDTEKVIVLPKDELLLKDDAFMVVAESDLCDLSEMA